MFHVSTLTRLDLSQNQLVTISGIGQLTNLQYIDLTLNKIDYLPDDMELLIKLKELRIGKNRLSARGIPQELFHSSLQFLDLSENKFTKLPLELSLAMMNVDTVRLHGNSWVVPEMQRLDANTSQDELKLMLSVYNDQSISVSLDQKEKANSDSSTKDKRKSIAMLNCFQVLIASKF